MTHDLNLMKIIRSFALSVRSFDYFKSFQRAYQKQYNVALSNSQILAILLDEHQQLTEADVKHE